MSFRAEKEDNEITVLLWICPFGITRIRIRFQDFGAVGEGKGRGRGGGKLGGG